MHAGTHKFGRFAMLLVGLLLALAAIAPAAQADPYNPADWAPSVWSDKADYAPGELVTLSGANWQAGETVNIVVNDDVGESWRRDVDVTADAAGAITDSFNLPDSFVAQYKVTATGRSSGAVATAAFTDGNVRARTNASGFTYRLDWTRHNATSSAPQTACAAAAAAQTTGFNAAVGFAVSAQFSDGVLSDSSIVLKAADVASDGRVFTGWSGDTASDTFLARPDPHEICVTGNFTGSRTYVANYAVNAAPTLTQANATGTVNEGQTATNTGTYNDANTGQNVGITASRGTVTKTGTNSGTWSWSFATTDGPDQTGPVVITADDGNGGTATTTFQLNVNNVAPTTTLAAGNPPSVSEGSTQQTYNYTISDPGADTVTAVTSCGANGAKVAGSDTNTNTTGSFKCTFADGLATSVVSASATDSDGAAGNLATQSVTVNNVAPTVTLTGPATADEGQTKSYSFTVTDPGVDTFAVEAGFPDCDAGATNNGTFVAGSLSVTATGGSFQCTFPDGPSTANVKIQVRDSDGAGTAASQSVQIVAVANVAPTVTAAANQTASEA